MKYLLITNDPSHVGKDFETYEEALITLNRIKDGYSKNIIPYVPPNPKSEPKAKPTVIKLTDTKIIFNPPYTIYTDGKVTGKAKCNPAEVYKAEIGLKLAVDRYYEAKKDRVEISILKFLQLLSKEME